MMGSKLRSQELALLIQMVTRELYQANQVRFTAARKLHINIKNVKTKVLPTVIIRIYEFNTRLRLFILSLRMFVQNFGLSRKGGDLSPEE